MFTTRQTCRLPIGAGFASTIFVFLLTNISLRLDLHNHDSLLQRLVHVQQRPRQQLLYQPGRALPREGEITSNYVTTLMMMMICTINPSLAVPVGPFKAVI